LRYALLLSVGLLSIGTAMSVGAFAALAQTPATPAAQPAAAAAKYDPTKPYPPYTAPRLKIGQPDLQGTWSNSTLTPMSRRPDVKDKAVYTEDEVRALEQAMVDEIEEGNAPTAADAPAEYVPPKNLKPEYAAGGGAVGGYNRFWLDPGNLVMRVNGEPRTSLFTTPNGASPPRKAGAQPAPAPEPPEFVKLLGPSPTPKGGAYDNPESRSSERCITSFGRNGGPPMFANGFYNNNYQIVQSPDAVVIVTEMVHDARIVRLNSKHRKDDVRPYFGDSIGWWDGDTLVVETTHIPQSQQFMGAWKNLTVTERFKRVADDRLYYGFTVEDPTLWDAPWGGEYEFHALGGSLYEYACHEGNYALLGVLEGARVLEEHAAAEAKKAAAVKPAGKPSKSRP
jgi:hypothetical protein